MVLSKCEEGFSSGTAVFQASVFLEPRTPITMADKFPPWNAVCSTDEFYRIQSLEITGSTQKEREMNYKSERLLSWKSFHIV